MNSSRRTEQSTCSLPLPPVLLSGACLSALFFGLILAGPLDFAILRRYCLSHPVAIASVCLFSIGIVGLTYKWFIARLQTKATTRATTALRRLITDGCEIAPSERAQWMAANWESMPRTVRASWFGSRVERVLRLQITRGRRHQLEADLKSLAEQDADQQHDSYSLLRIINWAMPMLGFLGTVLGISQTLGQLDTQLLATQQQEAMNQLTAGLYVAFDTTAIALTLTVFSMFVQFAVSRLEQNLLQYIDADIGDCLIAYLAADPYDAQDTLLAPVRDMIENLISGVRQLVVEQAALWSQSIVEGQNQWSKWSSGLMDTMATSVSHELDSALSKHLCGLERIHDEGNRQLDLRWQQWQTTLSDQARLIQGQQKEVVRQSDTLQRLVDSTTDLRKLEETIGDSIARLENINRLEEATTCVGEAVAVLATCLERAGVIRGAPVRPRPVKQIIESINSSADTTAVSSPQEPEQRKAA